MTAYFIDRDGALARSILPGLEHPAFFRVDNDMRVWLVFADGREETTDVFSLPDLRTHESFEEVSRAEALSLMNAKSTEQASPPAEPGADRPRTSPPDAW